MARVSKYEMLVGTETNGILVSNYRRLEKVSKTSGKRYYRYEVELNNILWVSTTSFNKGSYTKRLAKAMKDREEVKQTYNLIVHPLWARVYEAHAINTDEETINSGKFNRLNLANNIKELKRIYYQLCKIYHPDCGGSQEDFEMLQFCYDEEYRALRATEACMEELGISMEEYNRYFGC